MIHLLPFEGKYKPFFAYDSLGELFSCIEHRDYPHGQKRSRELIWINTPDKPKDLPMVYCLITDEFKQLLKEVMVQVPDGYYFEVIKPVDGGIYLYTKYNQILGGYCVLELRQEDYDKLLGKEA